MKWSLISGAIASAMVLAQAGSASAQTYNWSGLYAGINVGGTWGSSQLSSSTTCPTTGYYCLDNAAQANGPAIASDASGTTSNSGFTGGIQAGYNWQAGQIVFGAEADYNVLNVSNSVGGSRIAPVGNGWRYSASAGTDADWLVTLRGRLGFAVQSNILVYLTGGWAIADVEIGNLYTDNNLGAGATVGGRGGSVTSQTKVGGTIGGGVEWGFARNWTIKGEYLYVDLGTVSTTAIVTNTPVTGAGFGNSLTTSTDLSMHIARIGLNYKF